MSALGYYAEVAINGTDRPKLGNHLFGTYGRGFRCADGKWVYLAMLTPRQVAAMRDLIGVDALTLEDDQHVGQTVVVEV